MKSWAGTTVPFGCTHLASSSAPTIMPVLASSSGWKNGTMSPSSIARRRRNSRSIRSRFSRARSVSKWVTRLRPDDLARIECDVGVRQDLADVGTVGRGVSDPDADRRRQLAAGSVNCLAEHAMQLVGHRDGCLLVGTGKGDDELVATDAAGDTGAGDATLDSVGDDAQEVVATAMSQRVVDRLEPVEVDEEHSDGLRRGLADQAFQRLEHPAAIQQPCQRVVGCLMGQLLDGDSQLSIGLGELNLIAFDLGEQILAGLLQRDRGADGLAERRVDDDQRH